MVLSWVVIDGGSCCILSQNGAGHMAGLRMHHYDGLHLVTLFYIYIYMDRWFIRKTGKKEMEGT